MGCLIPPPQPTVAAVSNQIAKSMMHHLEKIAMTVHLILMKMLCYPQKVCYYVWFTCVCISLYT